MPRRSVLSHPPFRVPKYEHAVEMQVIAPYLVILRVAQRRALTSDMTTSGSGRVSSIRFRSQGTENSDNGTPSDEVLGTLMEENDVALGELGVGVGNGVSLDQGPNNP